MTVEGKTRRNSYVKKYSAEVRLDWQDRAGCLGLAPMFDYDQKAPTGTKAANPRPRKAPEHVEEAKRVCVFECEVREQCLAFALQTEIPRARSGILGGLDPNERDALYNEQMEKSA